MSLKMEEDTVAPLKSHFYKRYVDDTYIQRKKTNHFEKLNSYHLTMKLTIETKNPMKFLDTPKPLDVGVKSKHKFTICQKSFQ